MNRIQQISASPDVAPPMVPGLSGQVSSAAYLPGVGASPVALFAPLHYEPQYAYPLIVWLHGPGEDEQQLKRIMPLVSMRNYVSAAPRGTESHANKSGSAGRLRYGWSQRQSHVAMAEERVFEAIDKAQAKMNISPQRIFLAGYDCGGTMAFRIAMSHPRTFAGVVSLSGEFPRDRTPLADLAQARRLPLLLTCGRDSQHYDSESVCNNLKLFHTAGLNVALRQYPCGHELSPLMLADMDRWIMEQVTGVSSRTSANAD